MRGVIYARYSSDNQREESIEGQIRENTAYANKNGIDIVGTYIDRAYSAKTDNRPEFQRMIKDSAKKGFDVVKPINIPTSEEIEYMANSSDIQSNVSPKQKDTPKECPFVLVKRSIGCPNYLPYIQFLRMWGCLSA